MRSEPCTLTLGYFVNFLVLLYFFCLHLREFILLHSMDVLSVHFYFHNFPRSWKYPKLLFLAGILVLILHKSLHNFNESCRSQSSVVYYPNLSLSGLTLRRLDFVYNRRLLHSLYLMESFIIKYSERSMNNYFSY